MAASPGEPFDAARESQVETWEDFAARRPVIPASSGTSGTPTLYGVGEDDWQRAGHVFAMTQWAMSGRPDDIVQFAFPFNLSSAAGASFTGRRRSAPPASRSAPTRPAGMSS